MRLTIGLFAFVSVGLCQGPQLFGFLPNSGQFPPAVQFIRPSTTNTFYLTRDTFVLFNGVRIQVGGANPNARLAGDSPLSTSYNFYQGQNSAQWITGTRLFSGARLAGAYPGIDATFITTPLAVPAGTPIGQGSINFTVAPGADPSSIRVRVLNTGATPVTGPGGIWFAGGRVPGVFIVSVQARQISGGAATAIPSNLSIESSDTLSIQLSGRNATLETDIAVSFPDYDILSGPSSSAGLIASTVQYPTDFGPEGSQPAPACSPTCRKAVVANMDGNGNPLWVTVYGGSDDNVTGFVTAIGGGAAASGYTSSTDFPVTSTAPHANPGSRQDVYLAFFDGATGQLRNATYAGLSGLAFASGQIAGPANDVAVAGAFTPSSATRGFLLRWQPAQNRFLYSVSFPSAVDGLAFDGDADVFFTLAADSSSSAFQAGEVDSSGQTVGSMVSVPVPPNTQSNLPVIQPAPSGQACVAYQRWPSSGARPAVWVARIAPAQGTLASNVEVATLGTAGQIGMTPSGNLKLLITGPGPTEATTPDAPLVAACVNTAYFAVLKPDGSLVYATYVPATGFDFSKQNESTGPPPAAVSCFETTAGRIATTSAAPGELITIAGGGFGPAAPVFTTPGQSGSFPLSAGGLSVRIGGMDAPVIAIARGLIAVQVPYEIAPATQTATALNIEVSQNGTPMNTISLNPTSYAITLFDTGDRDNSMALPALAALNEDGTVNSASNPAPLGTVVSLYGSGAGPLAPGLPTGAIAPTPPAGSLSVSPLFRTCIGCSEILYLGSAPGLSTGIIQINVRIPAAAPGSGIRPLGIGIAVSQNQQGLFLFEPDGVVFIR